MKVSDYIANYIKECGVDTVFGYQGGNIAHIIDSISGRDDMRFIVNYNEQGSAFAACGYAIANETIGVAVASSGPGAVNLVSGISNAYYDSIPCLFITGNVSLPINNNVESARQNAFQQNDIVSMVKGVTKYAVTITDPNEVRYEFEKAIYIAQEGRPGPVLIDLPHNIQKSDVDFDSTKSYEIPTSSQADNTDYQKVRETLAAAKRPLVIVGGGASNSKARKAVGKLLEKYQIPVVCSLRGLDVLPHDSDLFVGFAGAYGNRYSNLAIKYADVLLVLGARLDERLISIPSSNQIFDDKTIIHIDIDDNELGHCFKNEVKVKQDVVAFCNALIADNTHCVYDDWINAIKLWKERYPSESDDALDLHSMVKKMTMNYLDAAYVIADVGIQQMCVAQSTYLHENELFLTSAGHGSMGCALPLAIGASSSSNRISTCFVGDGGLHMNIQELLTIVKNDLPVHIILLNNTCLGMIRDYQTKAFSSRFNATVDEFADIDYAAIAKAYGYDYYRVLGDDLSSIDSALSSKKPCFVEVLLPTDVDTNPKLGMDMFSQLPLLTESEILQIEKEVY